MTTPLSFVTHFTVIIDIQTKRRYHHHYPCCHQCWNHIYLHQVLMAEITSIHFKDHFVLLPPSPILATPALPLEPWTAHILAMYAAAVSVTTSFLVSPTQPQGLGAGNSHQPALLVVVRVSSGDTLANWPFSSVELLAAGVLSSPNYPGHYSHKTRMTHRIGVEQGLLMNLQFTYFDTEKCCDHLKITDGDGTVLMRASGNSLPMPTNISSTSNVINILFTTDSGVSRKGWSFSWSAVTPGGPTTSLQIAI